jgi:hypothetical protein
VWWRSTSRIMGVLSCSFLRLVNRSLTARLYNTAYIRTYVRAPYGSVLDVVDRLVSASAEELGLLTSLNQ